MFVKHRSRRLAFASAAAGAVAAAGVLAASSAAAGTQRTAAAGLRPCATSALKISPGGQGYALGTISLTLWFTNVSGTTCTLRGYPGVSGVTRTGRQIGNAAKRFPGPVRTITLAPGSRAYTTVWVAETAAYPKARCDSVVAAGMKVFPPNQFQAITLHHVKFVTCSKRSTTSVGVYPISKASGRRDAHAG